MRPFALLAILALTGCASTTSLQQAELKPSTAWVAAADGWADEATAVFGKASEYVGAQALARENGEWAVVLDLDETVLNNVQYQIGLDRSGQTYSTESWALWTEERAATLVPGVKDFIDTVNAAGGHVAFVTNRADYEQLATEENLAQLGLKRGKQYRVLLTRGRPNGAAKRALRA